MFAKYKAAELCVEKWHSEDRVSGECFTGTIMFRYVWNMIGCFPNFITNLIAIVSESYYEVF